MDNKEYWNKKILEWEDSMSRKEHVSFVEKLAASFRGALKYRADMSLNILCDFVKDKSILELGCGSGYFVSKLLNQCNAKHVTGMDISINAVNRAGEIASDQGLTDRCTFVEGDVTSAPLPEADVTVGLGFLDYLSPDDLTALFKNMKSRHFLFTFAEKKFSLSRYIHICYMFSQGCSKHFYYTKDEISSFIGGEYGRVQFINDKKISFGCIVHNLP